MGVKGGPGSDIGTFTNCRKYGRYGRGDQRRARYRADARYAFDVDNGNRVDAGKGFIQQDKFGISGQRGYFDTTAFTTGTAPVHAIAQMLDMKLHQLVGAGIILAVLRSKCHEFAVPPSGYPIR